MTDINELRKQIKKSLREEISEVTILRATQMVEIARDLGSSRYHKEVAVHALYYEQQLKELRLLNENISVLNKQISTLLKKTKDPKKERKKRRTQAQIEKDDKK